MRSRLVDLIVVAVAFLSFGFVLGNAMPLDNARPRLTQIDTPRPRLTQIDTPRQTAILQGLPNLSDNATISIDEAFAIIGEARESHILFKAALEIGMAQPTEWTGTIADQDRIIARYNKVLTLLESLKQAPVAEVRNGCCCQCSTK